ncbi:MAG: hypothetical protein WAN03_07015, partial [Candidatus Sulfotelmatobacter sp.]
LRGIHFDLSGLAAVTNTASAIASLAKAKLPPCASTIKRPPAGDARQEATMVYVASIVDLYRTTFGKLPENITDLDKVPVFEKADKLNGNEMKRTCSIQQMLSSRAYALSCGGTRPSAERLDSTLGKTVDEQFAIVDGIEVLHVPLSGGCI